MQKEATYTFARANFAALCNQTLANREPILIHRRGREDVALIAATELAGLQETAHLLRSSRNAQRLLQALERAYTTDMPTESVDKLRKDAGFESKE